MCVRYGDRHTCGNARQLEVSRNSRFSFTCWVWPVPAACVAIRRPMLNASSVADLGCLVSATHMCVIATQARRTQKLLRETVVDLLARAHMCPRNQLMGSAILSTLLALPENWMSPEIHGSCSLAWRG